MRFQRRPGCGQHAHVDRIDACPLDQHPGLVLPRRPARRLERARRQQRGARLDRPVGGQARELALRAVELDALEHDVRAHRIHLGLEHQGVAHGARILAGQDVRSGHTVGVEEAQVTPVALVVGALGVPHEALLPPLVRVRVDQDDAQAHAVADFRPIAHRRERQRRFQHVPVRRLLRRDLGAGRQERPVARACGRAQPEERVGEHRPRDPVPEPPGGSGRAQRAEVQHQRIVPPRRVPGHAADHLLFEALLDLHHVVIDHARGHVEEPRVPHDSHHRAGVLVAVPCPIHLAHASGGRRVDRQYVARHVPVAQVRIDLGRLDHPLAQDLLLPRTRLGLELSRCVGAGRDSAQNHRTDDAGTCHCRDPSRSRHKHLSACVITTYVRLPGFAHLSTVVRLPAWCNDFPSTTSFVASRASTCVNRLPRRRTYTTRASVVKPPASIAVPVGFTAIHSVT